MRVISSTSNPPMLAMATVARISIAHLNDLYIEYRMMKISSTVRAR